jgi:hypothetical protein
VILRVRIALLALGVIAFSVAQQTGLEWLRYVGIGFVGAALLLRFFKR